MVDIQSAAADIRRGIKKKLEDRKKSQGKNIMSAFATQGGHNKVRGWTNNNGTLFHTSHDATSQYKAK